MISCASDLILGTGYALKAVVSSEARSGSDSSVRNIRGSWMSATFVCSVVLSIGVQETIGNLKGGIARVEGCCGASRSKDVGLDSGNPKVESRRVVRRDHT